MVSDLARGDFTAVLVSTQDRFSRMEPADFCGASKPFIDAGITLVTADEGPKDWTSAIGQVVLAVGQLGKNQYLRDLSYHVTGSMSRHVREYQGWSSQAPF